MKKVTISTYKELFELWSTNKSFRAKYPYLPLLRANFMGKLEFCDISNNIEQYLSGISVCMLLFDNEEIEKYMFPYYDSYFVKNDMIDITSAFQRIYNLSSLIQYILIFGVILLVIIWMILKLYITGLNFALTGIIPIAG